MSPVGQKRRFERASTVSALHPFATKSVQAPSAGLGHRRTLAGVSADGSTREPND